MIKLLRTNLTTYNNFQYKVDEWVEATGEGKALCSDGVLHAYESPVHAALFSPIHVDSDYTLAYEAEGEVVANDGLKGGCKRLRIKKPTTLPEISLEKRIEFGIRCALKVCSEPAFVEWAEKWLSGEDRSEEAARAAGWAAEAAWAAREARAARAAGWAAEAAARAAEAAEAAEAAAGKDLTIINTVIKEMGL